MKFSATHTICMQPEKCFRWRSPVQLAFLEAHQYFRSNSITENLSWCFLKPYKYWRVHPPERQAQPFKSKIWKAQHMLVLCIIRHQDAEAFMKSEFPHRVTCQACARTHTLVKPPAAHEKIDGTGDTHSK